jgi:hypothetical protein
MPSTDEALKYMSEQNILDFLYGNKSLKFNSDDDNEARTFYTVENYVIKNYGLKDSKTNQYMTWFVDHLFVRFASNPEKRMASVILSDKDLIERFCKNYPKRMENYKKGLMALSNNWENIYNKIMNNQPVSEEERTRLMVLCTSNIDLRKNIPKDKAKFQKQITELYYKLLRDNKVPSNMAEREFIFNYTSRYTLQAEGYPEEKCNIRMINFPAKTDGFDGGYEKGGYIALNTNQCNYPNFYHTLGQMIQCASHETIHRIQELDAINKPDKVHGMEMAIQNIFAYEDYHTGENYLFSEIEEDANRRGSWYSGLLFGMAGNQVESEQQVKEKFDHLRKRKFQYEYVTQTGSDGKPFVLSKEKYNVINIRKIVNKHPELIQKYPALANLFNPDGSNKSFEELLCAKFVSHDIESMYSDFLLYDLMHGGLKNLDFNKLTPEQRKNASRKLLDLLSTEKDYLIDILVDYEYRETASDREKNKIKFLYQKHLDKYLEMSEFLLGNLAHLKALDAQESNLRSYGSFQSQYRAFARKYMAIGEEGHLGNLQEVTKQYSSSLNGINRTLKIAYMNDLCNWYNADLSLGPIFYNGESYSNLEDFINRFIFNHMDFDHYIKIENHLIPNESGYAMTATDLVKQVVKKAREENIGDNSDGSRGIM